MYIFLNVITTFTHIYFKIYFGVIRKKKYIVFVVTVITKHFTPAPQAARDLKYIFHSHKGRMLHTYNNAGERKGQKVISNVIFSLKNIISSI